MAHVIGTVDPQHATPTHYYADGEWVADIEQAETFDTQGKAIGTMRVLQAHMDNTALVVVDLPARLCAWCGVGPDTELGATQRVDIGTGFEWWHTGCSTTALALQAEADKAAAVGYPAPCHCEEPDCILYHG